MITFPNCKINLGLKVLDKRKDNYHNLETVFYPLLLTDALEIIQQDSPGIRFSQSGILVEGKPEENLCCKAYRLLKKDFPQLPAVQMHLHKAIPTGAGLGGGSADGAFCLILLNKKFEMNLTEKQLLRYAETLGSDCPFFILNKPCRASGRGDILEPITVNLSAYKFLIVHPGIHISTSWAFDHITPSYAEKSVMQAILRPVSEWKETLQNDFEIPVFNRYPEIKNLKDKLYQAGALYASMSGSGSSVFGIFRKEETISLTFPAHYFVKELKS